MNRGALERSRDTARAGSLVSARDLHACAIWGVINVTPDSLNVKVTYNTAPSVPNQGNGTWTVAGNKETGSVNACDTFSVANP